MKVFILYILSLILFHNARFLVFKASRGWLINFCKRRNFVLRRVSTTGRDLPTNAIDHIYMFYKQNSKLIEEHNFIEAQILNESADNEWMNQLFILMHLVSFALKLICIFYLTYF